MTGFWIHFKGGTNRLCSWTGCGVGNKRGIKNSHNFGPEYLEEWSVVFFF